MPTNLKLQLSVQAGGCVGTCSVVAGDRNHPNKLSFEGTLVVLDAPSNKPPHGARGHKILVPKNVAQKRLATLIGTGVNYDPGNLDEHMPRHKVGIITGAWIAGNKLKVKGHLWVKDFPEVEKHIKGKKDLGMSMELADVTVRDEHEDVWYLQDFSFTGATVLRKDAAAYYNTSLAASAAQGKGVEMAKAEVKKTKKAVAAAAGIDEQRLARLIASAVREGNKDLVGNVSTLVNKVDELSGVVIQGAAADVDEDEEEVITVAAGADDDDEDDDDVSAAEDDDVEDDDEEEEYEEEMSAELEDLEEEAPVSEPGEVNKNMKKKGSKTTTTEVGAEGILPKPKSLVKASHGMQAAAQAINSLRASNIKLRKQLNAQKQLFGTRLKKMNNKLKRVEAQSARAADEATRRSAVVIPNDLHNLAAKSGVDLNDLHASGSKMSVEQVNAMIETSGYDVTPVQRMAWKNRLVQIGLMDDGISGR